MSWEDEQLNTNSAAASDTEDMSDVPALEDVPNYDGDLADVDTNGVDAAEMGRRYEDKLVETAQANAAPEDDTVIPEQASEDIYEAVARRYGNSEGQADGTVEAALADDKKEIVKESQAEAPAQAEGDAQAGAKSLPTQAEVEAVASLIASRKEAPAREIDAAIDPKSFGKSAILTSIFMLLSTLFVLFAMGGAWFAGLQFAKVGNVELSPYGVLAAVDLIQSLRQSFSMGVLFSSIVPLLGVAVYALAMIGVAIGAVRCFISFICVVASRNFEKRRSHYSGLRRGTLRCYSAAICPLVISLLSGAKLTMLGIAVLAMTALLYLMYVWIFSWYHSADNEANLPDRKVFLTDALRKTLALGTLAVLVYSLTAGWLTDFTTGVLSATTNVSDAGLSGLIGYYLSYLRPLYMAFLALLAYRYLRKAVRAYGGDFGAGSRRRIERMEDREDNIAYRINTGLARLLIYLFICFAFDCVQASALYGADTKGLFVLFAMHWLPPIFATIATSMLLGSGVKRERRIKKYRKKKRKSKGVVPTEGAQTTTDMYGNVVVADAPVATENTPTHEEDLDLDAPADSANAEQNAASSAPKDYGYGADDADDDGPSMLDRLGSE